LSENDLYDGAKVDINKVNKVGVEDEMNCLNDNIFNLLEVGTIPPKVDKY